MLVRSFGRSRPARFGALVTLATAVACGRSERVGWTGRDMPDSVARAAEAATDGAAEHERLLAVLAPLQRRALEDSALASQWAALQSEAEARIVERSSFYGKLIERRNEIEALMRAQGEAVDTLSLAQRSELIRHYQNIQQELARVKTDALRSPEFAARLKAFQTALFAKMREFEPERAAEVDRLERFETELFSSVDSAAPGPGSGPGR